MTPKYVDHQSPCGHWFSASLHVTPEGIAAHALEPNYSKAISKPARTEGRALRALGRAIDRLP